MRVHNLTKTFPGVVANDNVNLEIKEGEIHALLGENGAGKTTLMNCIYGLEKYDSGTIYWRDEEVTFKNIKDAIDVGIGMVHQHFMLAQSFTVAENIILGLQEKGYPRLLLEDVYTKILKLSEEYGLQVNPKKTVLQLSVGEQQRVEIIKALYRDVDLLILDEPTAVLAPSEVGKMFEILKEMTQKGLTIVFISHKLDEVLRISDRITVMRDGKVVDTVNSKDTSRDELAKMMVGRDIQFTIKKEKKDIGDVVLAVEDLWVKNDINLQALRGVNFEVREGEILGIAGVDGNGQLELEEALVGLRKAQQGKIKVLGKDIASYDAGMVLKSGLSHIPSDRIDRGIFSEMTVAENIMADSMHEKPYSKYGVIDFDLVYSKVSSLIKSYNIKTSGYNQKVSFLSGGNQQRLLMARCFKRDPAVIIAAQPTRGLDIGGCEYIQQQIIRASKMGSAVVYISNDLSEILAISDRIAVINQGEIVGIVQAEDAKVEEIGLMMTGSKSKKRHDAHVD